MMGVPEVVAERLARVGESSQRSLGVPNGHEAPSSVCIFRVVRVEGRDSLL